MAAVAPPSGVELLRLLGAGAYGNLYVGRYSDIDDRGVARCHPAFVKVSNAPCMRRENVLLKAKQLNQLSLAGVVY